MKIIVPIFLLAVIASIENVAFAEGAVWTTSVCPSMTLSVTDKFVSDKNYDVKYMVKKKDGEIFVAERSVPKGSLQTQPVIFPDDFRSQKTGSQGFRFCRSADFRWAIYINNRPVRVGKFSFD